MRPRASVLCTLSVSALLLPGCGADRALEPSSAPLEARISSGFATMTKLPPVKGGSGGEAYAVDGAGAVIVGYNWLRDGRMSPVMWALQSGVWQAAALPYPSSASSAVARAVSDQREIAGNDFPAATPHALLWPSTGGFELLGCGELGEVYGISAAGRMVVGVDRSGSSAIATLWQPGRCRENLPPLAEGGGAHARAISGDGGIVGGGAFDPSVPAFVPVRWLRAGGVAQVERLDVRRGTVYGGNSAGDLVGTVNVPCASASGCQRGVVWYAAGGSLELGTLGGESTVPRAINAAGEVVGSSDVAGGGLAPFIWSAAAGMRQLPLKGGGWAFGVSGVRANGTRLVVGVGGNPGAALVWEVR